jgi:hypothetical protein
MIAGARGALVVLLGASCVVGCEPQRSAHAPRPWIPYAPQPYYATRGPDPYALPGGSEARDPWSSRPQPVAATMASPTPDAGTYLIVTTLSGPSAVEREPSVNALIARLGGVRRAPSLWELTPVPGGGLGTVAAALEKELCAEDIAVIYRARGQSMERSEFAGHKVCAPPPAPPAPPAPAKKPGGDPLRTRF